MGYDTYIRVLESSGLFERLRMSANKLLVAGRCVQGNYEEITEIPFELRNVILKVPGFRVDLSSTELR